MLTRVEKADTRIFSVKFYLYFSFLAKRLHADASIDTWRYMLTRILIRAINASPFFFSFTSPHPLPYLYAPATPANRRKFFWLVQASLSYMGAWRLALRAGFVLWQRKVKTKKWLKRHFFEEITFRGPIRSQCILLYYRIAQSELSTKARQRDVSELKDYFIVAKKYVIFSPENPNF